MTLPLLATAVKNFQRDFILDAALLLEISEHFRVWCQRTHVSPSRLRWTHELCKLTRAVRRVQILADPGVVGGSLGNEFDPQFLQADLRKVAHAYVPATNNGKGSAGSGVKFCDITDVTRSSAGMCRALVRLCGCRTLCGAQIEQNAVEFVVITRVETRTFT